MEGKALQLKKQTNKQMQERQEGILKKPNAILFFLLFVRLASELPPGWSRRLTTE